ncbi:MAG: ANTAR domain-containing response regulator [Candidatus Aquicultorales bacterium]
MAKTRVVIAEDESIIRMDLKEMLVESGYDVVGEAADGAEAVRLAFDLSPDLIVLDVKMPVMNGIDAAREITEAGICPAIILTAYSQRALVDKAIESGAMSYLVKPFSKSDLLPAIEVAIKRFKDMKALEGKVKELEDQLTVRKLVEQAKGILMKEEGLDEADAFRKIQKESMDKRIGIKDVAEDIIARQ